MTRHSPHTVKVFLHDTSTGVRGIHIMPWYGDQDGGYDELRFWLRDGNGGCDCTRADWLNGSKLPCSGGKNRVTIEKAQNEHGTTVYTDTNPYRRRKGA